MQVDLKKIKPIGIVFILAFSVIAFLFCFKADMGIPPAYESLHNWEYYKESENTLNELKTELESNIFPYFNTIQSCVPDSNSKKLVITLNNEKEISKLKAVLNRDFNLELFDLNYIEGN